jgi:hypothetical protein
MSAPASQQLLGSSPRLPPPPGGTSPVTRASPGTPRMRAHAGPVTGRQDPHQADAPHGWAATRPARRPETRRVPVPRGAAARRQGPARARQRPQ